MYQSSLASDVRPSHPLRHFLPDLPAPPERKGHEDTRDNDYTEHLIHVPPASGPVGGRLLELSRNWTCITTDLWVLQTVSLGYLLEFTTSPPRPRELPHRPTPVPLDSTRRSSLEKEIASLLEKKAVVPFPANTAMGFTSTFFLAPKKSGEWRPIINLRPLNAYIRPKHFRMETLTTVLQTLPQGWWATSLDLKDAYLHVSIHANHQMFLQFIYQNITYLFWCLPFSLSTAPRVFTRITKVLAAALRRQHVRLYIYCRPLSGSHPPGLIKDYSADAGVGLHYQCREVFPHSISKPNVPVNPPRHDLGQRHPFHRSLYSPRGCSSVPLINITSSSSLASSSGFHGKPGRHCAMVQDAYAPTPTSLALPLSSSKGCHYQAGHGKRHDPVLSKMMALTSERSVRYVVPTTFSIGHSNHGRIGVWLVCSPRRHFPCGNLVPSGATPTRQPPGAPGCSQSLNRKVANCHILVKSDNSTVVSYLNHAC